MKILTISEIKTKKGKLENEILVLLRKFEDETKTEIADLDIERLRLCGKGNCIIKIEAGITL